MPIYWYKAITTRGETVTGYREFSDLISLDRFISSYDMTLVDVKEIPKPAYTFLEIFLIQKVKRREIIELCTNLSLLVSGGLPLADSLRDLAETTKNKTLRNVLKAIYRDLEEGFLLSESMAKHPKVFPEVMVNLVKIGEETGELGKMLKDAAEHLERVDSIISNTKRALIYPAFVLLAMTGAFFFWMIYVLPKVLSMFQSMGIAIPLPTRILIGIVSFVNRFWFLFLIPPFLLLAFYIASRYNEKVKRTYHWLLLKLPIFGPIVKNSAIAFFFEYFSLLITAGTSMFKALRTMEKSTPNLILREVIIKIHKKLASGANIQEAFAAPGFFEPLVIRMVSVGASTGDLDAQLRYIANFYMERVNKMVEVISKVLEPVVLVGAAILLVLIILGLLGPIYDMLGKIKG